MGLADFNPLPAGGQMFHTMNSVKKENLERRKQEIENQYLPYISYADAQSKMAQANYLPWQIQSQILSNPYLALALKDNPAALNKMMEDFGKNMPTAGSMSNTMNMPLPGQNQGNGLTALIPQLINKLMGRGGQQPQQGGMQPSGSMPTQQPGNSLVPTNQPSGGRVNALVPGATSTAQGLIGSQTAKILDSPHQPGVLIPDPNNPGQTISTPTASTTESTQKAILASKRVAPILTKLADQMGEFLTLEGKAKELSARAGNLLGFTPEQLKEAGLDANMPSRYASAQSKVKIAPADLLKSFGLDDTVDALHRLGTSMEPILGEGKEGYKARVLETLQSIMDDQVGVNQAALHSGFSSGNASQLGLSPAAQNEGMAQVSNPQIKEPTPDDIEYTAKMYHMTVPKVKELLGIK